MTTQITLVMYGLYILTFILGQALTIFWWDIPQVRALAARANHDFIWKDYWAKEWNMIIGLEILGTIVFLVLDQIIHWKPTILEQMWWISPIFGMLGSGIGGRFGAYRKKMLDLLDKKANIADYGTPVKPASIPDPKTE
jgi:hypothetical protein